MISCYDNLGSHIWYIIIYGNNTIFDILSSWVFRVILKTYIHVINHPSNYCMTIINHKVSKTFVQKTRLNMQLPCLLTQKWVQVPISLFVLARSKSLCLSVWPSEDWQLDEQREPKIRLRATKGFTFCNTHQSPFVWSIIGKCDDT